MEQLKVWEEEAVVEKKGGRIGEALLERRYNTDMKNKRGGRRREIIRQLCGTTFNTWSSTC